MGPSNTPRKATLEQKIIGKTLEQAQKMAEAVGKLVRAEVVDGQDMVLTMDYRTNRLNVTVTEGKIATFNRHG